MPRARRTIQRGGDAFYRRRARGQVKPRVWPGRPFPLGAIYDGYGTNFAVFSSVATRVVLCLFDAADREQHVELTCGIGQIWHAYLPEVGPGTRYGFRVDGPWQPADGLRCNPHKLLVDPYARALAGDLRWGPAVFGFDRDPMGARSREDDARSTFRSVVGQPYFDWGNDRRLEIPWSETVIYECHVKGLTMQRHDLPAELRGTYAGVGHPAMLEHLRRLGVTAVELLPVHAFVHDGFLLERGLRNYWGYNSIAYFAPHPEYASADDPLGVIAEFKQMVRALHRAGIEVILDVVYNHTAEGNHLGPTLSLRGIDNPAYYCLVPDQPGYYLDVTGTGNTLHMRHPSTLQLVMDSLRYWIEDMHVDGFRFDLAAALARGPSGVDRLAAFFELIQQDPVVSRVKLIAEPWDLGEGGYQVGRFPALWSEWNGRYRDAIRDYWRGQAGLLPELGTRITGSADLYQRTGRAPSASINFVTVHDGFALRDLVSYDRKHNEANLEGNRDGDDDNRSWNCGVEGPTGDPDVLRLRARQQRNLLATLFLSQGVPLLLGGDELGRTQRGNNNAYCQDNAISWFDWDAIDERLLEFTRALARLRREHPVFRRRDWFPARSRPRARGGALPPIAWFDASGAPMSPAAWTAPASYSVQLFLNGVALDLPGDHGERVVDDTFLLVLHAEPATRTIVLPPARWGACWRRVMDTERGFAGEHGGERVAAGGDLEVIGRSLWLLRCDDPAGPRRRGRQ